MLKPLKPLEQSHPKDVVPHYKLGSVLFSSEFSVASFTCKLCSKCSIMHPLHFFLAHTSPVLGQAMPITLCSALGSWGDYLRQLLY